MPATLDCRTMTPTPLETAPAALAQGRDVWLKREDQHELGAFKWRGALPAMRAFRDAGATTVVTASTGNHGAASAWAAAQLGMRAIVYAPEGSTQAKLDLIERHGGEMRIFGADFDLAKDEAERVAAAEGMPFFADGAEPPQYGGYAEIARRGARPARPGSRRHRRPRRERRASGRDRAAAGRARAPDPADRRRRHGGSGDGRELGGGTPRGGRRGPDDRRRPGRARGDPLRGRGAGAGRPADDSRRRAPARRGDRSVRRRRDPRRGVGRGGARGSARRWSPSTGRWC